MLLLRFGFKTHRQCGTKCQWPNCGSVDARYSSFRCIGSRKEKWTDGYMLNKNALILRGHIDLSFNRTFALWAIQMSSSIKHRQQLNEERLCVRVDDMQMMTADWYRFRPDGGRQRFEQPGIIGLSFVRANTHASAIILYLAYMIQQLSICSMRSKFCELTGESNNKIMNEMSNRWYEKKMGLAY